MGKWILAFAVMASLVTVQSASAKMIVVGATGPSANDFQLGKTLSSDSYATLQRLDVVVVVDEAGTRVFKGPGEVHFGRANTPEAGRWSDIRAMVAKVTDRSRKTRVLGTAATRSFSMPEPPLQRQFAVEWPQGGHYCFDPEAGIEVERSPIENESEAIRFTITAHSAPIDAIVDAAPGQATFSWPETLLPESGEQGEFDVSSGNEMATVSLTAVPVRALDLIALAEFVTAKKCTFAYSLFATKADQMEGR